MKLIPLMILLVLGSSVFGAELQQGYYRFPAIHGNSIVFTAEGDLWRVAVTGGVAQRLTTHPGIESHAKISPDGQTIAFSAEYEGPAEVYSMPLNGGLPTRHTFDGGTARVAGWTPDGLVLQSTEVFSTLPNWQLATIDTKTGSRRVIPLAQASQGAFDPADPSGRTLIFTRLSKQGSSTKRYHGGWVENLWRFRDGEPEAVPLTASFTGTSRNPMWWQDRVHFASDRDGLMNLWSMKPDGSSLEQSTHHKDFDVKSPSLHGGRIVYQHGANLRLFDIVTKQDSALEIRLASDFDQLREKWVKKPLEFLTAAHISPSGDRVVLTARGQVFVAPVEKGRSVEIPRKPNVRYRNARFLPDGKFLLALSDESGELEFWRLPANGVGSPQPLTTNGAVFRFSGVPSPDGKSLIWADKNQKLWLHELDTQRTSLVDESPRNAFDDYLWSPDSQWIAYTKAAPNLVQQIHVYNVKLGSRIAVTSDRVESRDPAWSPDGKWLYFLSDRELRSLVASPWGPRQPEPHFTETTKIYGLALAKNQRWPFAPIDELQPSAAEEKKDEADKPPGDDSKPVKPAAGDPNQTAKDASQQKEPKKGTMVIEQDGLPSRLYEVPVPAGNYSNLKVTAKHLLWTSREVGFGAKANLRQIEFSRKDPKPKTLVEDVRNWELSLDLKKLLVRKGDSFHIIASDASAPAKLDEKIDLEGWTFSISPGEEWRQIFTESWRMMRDYFYDRGMHGLDWSAMHRKYLPLVARVSDRTELSDVIYEMVGELSTLHINVTPGDRREGPDQILPATLGARLERDESAGGWRVSHIYRADPDYPEQLAPLARPEADVAVGDVLLGINGHSTLSVPHPAMLLRNQAGKQVLLEVQSRDGGPARRVIVKPNTVEREASLRYDEWELTRRERVETLGKGQIGYVHLRAMGSADIAQWARDYFPVFQRQGLVIDVRNNRGGNIDSWILEKLLRKAWFYWQPRVGEPYWNMQYAFRGHLVVLCNERTASDGEAFAEGFKRLGLGKVIGTRTWGGEIWLSAQRWLIDSGMATAAEFGVYGPEGAWLIEGHGVDPDLVVDNLPHATFLGKDAQLDAAIKHLQELIAQDPRPVPPAPKYPDKTFKP